MDKKQDPFWCFFLMVEGEILIVGGRKFALFL